MPKLTNKDHLDKLAKALDARAKASIKASVAEESARAQEVETTLQGQIADTLDMFGGKAIRYITQAQYNQLSDEEKNDPTVAYFITDAEDLSHSHSNKNLLDSFGARTLTIGSKGKTFDGSQNVNWTLAEIGAAESGHNHDDRYYTETEINTKVTNLQSEIDADVKVEADRAKAAEAALQAAIDGKSGSSHLHDDRYYTESEMNTKLSTLKSDLQKEIDSDVLVETNRAKAEEQALQSAIDGKSPLGHAHDDRYLTEEEIEDLADDLRLAIEAAVEIEEERAMAAEQGLQAKIDQKANASHGNHVPTTETANNARFLRNDNTWQTITPANIGASATGHSHDDKYYTETEIDAKITTINTAINGKAPSGHTHDDRYYTESEINTKVTDLQKEIDDDVKALETSLQAKIDQKSPVSHNHNDVYYTEAEIDDQMGDMLDAIDEAVTEEANRAKGIEASLDAAIKTKSDSGHLHDDRYYVKSTIDSKVTALQSEIDADVKVEVDRAKAAEAALQANIDKKSNEGHNHDGRYYTETEIDGKVEALQEEIAEAVETEADRAKAAETTLQANIDKKANSGHTHDDRYYTESEINTKISNLQSEIDADVLVETNRAKGAENTLQANIDKKADKSHGNHVPATETANNAKFLRNDNTWATVTPANIGAAASVHSHNDLYYTETEIDSKVTTLNGLIDGKADKSHGNHVPTTQTANNAVFLRNDNTWQTVTPDNIGAAKASHGTHVTYASATPLANGTAAIGSSGKVAREDHVHPLQTEISGNAGSADVLSTPRNITIGNQTNAFDGSENITYTLSAIGASAEGHNHDGRYYTESEINTKITNLQAEIDSDVKVEADRAKAAENTLQANIDKKANVSHGNHVPTTQTAANNVFLRNDNTWATVTPANIGASAEGHAHDGRYYTETEIDAKITTINSSIATAKSDAQKYADQKITALVDSAPEAMNTLNELATAISDHQDVYDAYVAEIDAKLAQKSDKTHTHNYAGSSSAGGAATSANKVNSSLKVQLNSGTTEGTNQFTFNGSAAKTINITPDNIGAAKSSHGTHVTYANTTPSANGTAAIGSSSRVAREDHVHPLQTSVSGNAGSADKLSTGRTITIGNKSNTFDGSANISYSLSEIGASESGHTHNYAGSSSAGGAATSANKVNQNLAIKLNGGTTEGSNLFTFNGSAAKSINITPSSIGAAASSHGTHVGDAYATATPKANGTAAVGTSSKIAREDHVHPLQTTISGNAATSSKWANPITMTIGDKGKTVDGSANVSWTLTEIGAAAASHNHTSLTGITSLAFAAESSDAASISTTVDSSNTYFDFNLKDDASANDMWRWRFTPSGGTVFNAMTLDATSTTAAKLTVAGEVNATSFTENGTTLSNKYAAKSHGTHVGDAYATVAPKANGTAAVGTSSRIAREDHVHPLQTTISGNAATASKWQNAIVLQIGNSSQSLDGSANVSYTLAQIGAAAASHGQHSVYGTCDTAAATAEKAVTISGSGFSLSAGQMIAVKFTNSNSASSVKLNVNSTGAKPIWYNTAEYTGNSKDVCGYAGRITTYMYNGSHWVWVSSGTDNNSTYSPQSLGFGYGTCDTAEATTAKVATLASYGLIKNGIVSIKFSYAVPASSTLNINSKGAKPIYFRNTAITANVIKAGDTATFIYDNSYYQLLSVDRWHNDIINHTHNYAGSSSAGGSANSAVKLASAKNITIGGQTKSFDGSAAISFDLPTIGAEPLQKTVVARTVSSGTLTLTKDKYQSATLATGNTIALPSVSNFTEINLFVKDCSIANINLPDNCKWRVDPNLSAGTSFIFTFIYTGQEWLAEVKIYS